MAQLLEVPIERGGMPATIFINPLRIDSVERMALRTLVTMGSTKIIVLDTMENVILAVNQALA